MRALGVVLAAAAVAAVAAGGLPPFPPGCKLLPPNLAPLPSPLPPTVTAALGEVTAALKSNLAAPWAPGGQVMVAYRNTTLLSAVAGYANVSAALPVAEDTIFRMGSISKLFPALLLLQLVSAGKLGLDAPIAASVPDFAVINPWDDSAVTWRTVLQQRSGLLREAPPGNSTSEVRGARGVRRQWQRALVRTWRGGCAHATAGARRSWLPWQGRCWHTPPAPRPATATWALR